MVLPAGFVVGTGDPVPAYTDPISPSFSTDISNSFTSSALYDSVNVTTTATSGIYHEPAQIDKQPNPSRAASEDHYEMGAEGHYEMEQPYSEPMTSNGRQDISSVGSASPYEEPINSTSSTMTTNHYEINSQMLSLRVSIPTHDCNVQAMSTYRIPLLVYFPFTEQYCHRTQVQCRSQGDLCA